MLKSANRSFVKLKKGIFLAFSQSFKLNLHTHLCTDCTQISHVSFKYYVLSDKRIKLRMKQN